MKTKSYLPTIGCLCVVILCVALPVFLYFFFFSYSETFYIPEIKTYVRLERIPFVNAKMYFSKTEEMGKDYVVYDRQFGDMMYLDVYFVPPNTVCVSGASEIKQESFNIKEFKVTKSCSWRQVSPNKRIPEYYDEYSDSTMFKNPSYHFDIDYFFYGFTLYNPEEEEIFTTKNEKGDYYHPLSWKERDKW